MARAYFYRFTVESQYPFPTDMLRYDECWPADSESAHMIALSHEIQGELGKRTYTLNTRIPTGPTVARWESFMFKVTEIEDQR